MPGDLKKIAYQKEPWFPEKLARANKLLGKMDLQEKTDSNNELPQSRKRPKVKASGNVKDYSNDPFFVKKADESKAFLEKHGFPKEIMGGNKIANKRFV